MTSDDITRIGWVGLGLLLTLFALCLMVFDLHTALSFLGGGVLGWINFRVMVWLFRQIIEGGAGAGWYTLPLVGKFGLLLAAILVAGFWLRADILALAVGFSVIVFSVTMIGSIQYLRSVRRE